MLAPSLFNNTFDKNEAVLYGDDLASYPVKIGFIDTEMAMDLLGKEAAPVTIVTQDVLLIEGFRSGGVLSDLAIATVDASNQVVTNVNGDIVYTTVREL